MSEKAWAHTGIIMFILMILALSLFIFGKRVVLKKVGFIPAIFFFLELCDPEFAVPAEMQGGRLCLCRTPQGDGTHKSRYLFKKVLVLF